MIDIDQIAAEAADLLVWPPCQENINIIKAAIEKASKHLYELLDEEGARNWGLRKEGDATCPAVTSSQKRADAVPISDAAPDVQPVAAAAGQEKWTVEDDYIYEGEDFPKTRFIGRAYDSADANAIAAAHNATLPVMSNTEVELTCPHCHEKHVHYIDIDEQQSDDTKRLESFIRQARLDLSNDDPIAAAQTLDAAIEKTAAEFYYCNKCGYSGSEVKHEGCNYNAYPTPPAAATSDQKLINALKNICPECGGDLNRNQHTDECQRKDK